jgi:hypothetical protein
MAGKVTMRKAKNNRRMKSFMNQKFPVDEQTQQKNSIPIIAWH